MATISADAVRQFNDQGYYAPIRALTSEEAANLRDRLEIFESTNSGLTAGLRNKPHLLLTWLDELVRHPGVFDAVEQVIGPNMRTGRCGSFPDRTSWTRCRTATPSPPTIC
jgi:non-haem Fe2+, alpha-ketoglutarate-dependent halogenase